MPSYCSGLAVQAHSPTRQARRRLEPLQAPSVLSLDADSHPTLLPVFFGMSHAKVLNLMGSSAVTANYIVQPMSQV